MRDQISARIGRDYSDAACPDIHTDKYRQCLDRHECLVPAQVVNSIEQFEGELDLASRASRTINDAEARASEYIERQAEVD